MTVITTFNYNVVVKLNMVYWDMLCNWLTCLPLKQKLWVRIPLSQHINALVVQWIRIRHYGCHDEGSIPSRGTKFIMWLWCNG